MSGTSRPSSRENRFPASSRSRAITHLRTRLEQNSWPRVQMAFLVMLTGASGFLASFLLLQAGLQVMWVRYPVSVGIAYGVFLLLLWLWMKTQAADYADVPVASGDGASSGSANPENVPDLHSGGGGDFGGGGASTRFDVPTGPGDLPLPGARLVGDGLASAADADEAALPLLGLLLIAVLFVGVLGAAVSSFYILYAAPGLFAELLLDGVLAATLYRRLRHLESRHWLETAVRRTALPFALTAALLGAGGAAMQWYAPQAHSLGGVLQQAASRP